MNNFTPRAQQVLALARKEADRFNHSYVGTEHILLGLIKLGQGVAVNVLQKMGLDLETVRMEVENQVGSGPETKMVGNIPYTPRVKKVLALAGKEAKVLNHSYVGTEHILLGLVQEGSGVAANVLKNLDVDSGKIRAEIERQVQTGHAMVHMGQLPFTPRAKRVLELCQEAAKELRHNYIGTEHLLLGLIREEQGVAATVDDLPVTNFDIYQRINLENALGARLDTDFATRKRVLGTLINEKVAKSQASKLKFEIKDRELNERIESMVGRMKVSRADLAKRLGEKGVNEDTLKNQIEGSIQEGSNVVVIEDLISTGKSSLNAINALKSEGFNVMGMLSIFSYNFQFANKKFEDENISINSLSDYNSLVEKIESEGSLNEIEINRLKTWREDPKIWK